MGLCDPRSPPGEGSSSPRTLSRLSLLPNPLHPWDEGHKGSTFPVHALPPDTTKPQSLQGIEAPL